MSFVYKTAFQSSLKVDVWYQCQLITELTEPTGGTEVDPRAIGHLRTHAHVRARTTGGAGAEQTAKYNRQEMLAKTIDEKYNQVIFVDFLRSFDFAPAQQSKQRGSFGAYRESAMFTKDLQTMLHMLMIHRMLRPNRYAAIVAPHRWTAIRQAVLQNRYSGKWC